MSPETRLANQNKARAKHEQNIAMFNQLLVGQSYVSIGVMVNLSSQRVSQRIRQTLGIVARMVYSAPKHREFKALRKSMIYQELRKDRDFWRHLIDRYTSMWKQYDLKNAGITDIPNRF